MKALWASIKDLISPPFTAPPCKFCGWAYWKVTFGLTTLSKFVTTSIVFLGESWRPCKLVYVKVSPTIGVSTPQTYRHGATILWPISVCTTCPETTSCWLVVWPQVNTTKSHDLSFLWISTQWDYASDRCSVRVCVWEELPNLNQLIY